MTQTHPNTAATVIPQILTPLSEAIKIVGGRKACDHCFNCLYHTGRRHFFDGFLCARCGYWETMVLGVLEAGFDPEVQKHMRISNA